MRKKTKKKKILERDVWTHFWRLPLKIKVKLLLNASESKVANLVENLLQLHFEEASHEPSSRESLQVLQLSVEELLASNHSNYRCLFVRYNFEL